MIVPLFLIAGKLLILAAVTAIAVAVVITYETLVQTLQRHKLDSKDIRMMVGEQLRNGHYKVVAGVFSKRPMGIFPRQLRHREALEGKLDDHLKSLVESGKRVRIEI